MPSPGLRSDRSLERTVTDRTFCFPSISNKGLLFVAVDRSRLSDRTRGSISPGPQSNAVPAPAADIGARGQEHRFHLQATDLDGREMSSLAKAGSATPQTATSYIDQG